MNYSLIQRPANFRYFRSLNNLRSLYPCRILYILTERKKKFKNRISATRSARNKMTSPCELCLPSFKGGSSSVLSMALLMLSTTSGNKIITAQESMNAASAARTIQVLSLDLISSSFILVSLSPNFVFMVNKDKKNRVIPSTKNYIRNHF
jgi:hypothetical protein